MIEVRAKAGHPVFINADCIESFHKYDGDCIMIHFSSGKEVETWETVEEFLAKLEEARK